MDCFDPSWRNNPSRVLTWVSGVIFGSLMLPVGCALVMDTDFDKYEEASSEAKPDAASAGEAAQSEP